MCGGPRRSKVFSRNERAVAPAQGAAIVWLSLAGAWNCQVGARKAVRMLSPERPNDSTHGWVGSGTPPICYRPRRGDDGMMTSKNSLIIAPVILLLSASALAQQPDARRGFALAREHCSPCHAIDNTSESPRAAAPPFRELRLKYAVSDLQRPLTQGPHTRFQFEPSQIEALMAYLKTLDR